MGGERDVVSLIVNRAAILLTHALHTSCFVLGMCSITTSILSMRRRRQALETWCQLMRTRREVNLLRSLHFYHVTHRNPDGPIQWCNDDDSKDDIFASISTL